MQNKLHILFPPSTPSADVKAMLLSLQKLEGIVGTGSAAPRGLEPSGLMGWIELSSALLAAVGQAVVLVKDILDEIRTRKISGVTLTFSDGTRISVDEATVVEIEQLARSLAFPASRKES